MQLKNTIDKKTNRYFIVSYIARGLENDALSYTGNVSVKTNGRFINAMLLQDKISRELMITLKVYMWLTFTSILEVSEDDFKSWNMCASEYGESELEVECIK